MACKVIANLAPKVLSVCSPMPKISLYVPHEQPPPNVQACIKRVKALNRIFRSRVYRTFIRASWGQDPVEKLMERILEDLLEIGCDKQKIKLLQKELSTVEPSMPSENTLTNWREGITKRFGSHRDTEHEQQTRHQELQAICKPGTCEWLLKSPEFENWKDKRRQTLYCPGLPGSGKTVMTSLVATRLRESPDQRPRNTPEYDSKGPLEEQGVAVFYCGHDKHTSTAILACLSIQLLSPLITMVLHKDLKQPKESAVQSAWEKMKVKFEQISKEYNRLFVLIDGLDRCEQAEQENLIRLFSRLKVNLFFTSRILPGTTGKFGKCGRTITFRIAAEDSDIRKHATEYVRRWTFTMSKDNIDSIIEQSKRMYVYKISLTRNGSC